MTSSKLYDILSQITNTVYPSNRRFAAIYKDFIEQNSDLKELEAPELVEWSDEDLDANTSAQAIQPKL